MTECGADVPNWPLKPRSSSCFQETELPKAFINIKESSNIWKNTFSSFEILF